MTETWELDHRDKKRIREVKRKARPGKENGTFAIYNLHRKSDKVADVRPILAFSSPLIYLLHAALNRIRALEV